MRRFPSIARSLLQRVSRLRVPLLCACILAHPPSIFGAEKLPALNVDIAETSVSGLSSGAFMAAQFEVAHSSIVRGAGIVAGGPYYCGQDSMVVATTRCTCTLDPAHLACSVSPVSTDVGALKLATLTFASQNLIDAAANLEKHRVLIIAGGKDPIVPPPIADQLALYYADLSVPSASVSKVKLANAGHTMPTIAYGNNCALTESPYIGKCNFDGAKEILGWIYGPLKAKRKGSLTGRFVNFDQTPYVTTTGFLWLTGIDTTGWVYIPKVCARGERCRLHIALHGCEQGQTYVPLKTPPGGGLYYGTTFVRNAGYIAWADTNKIVVLFPQAVSIPGLNPNGCWDWWGYTDSNYANKSGVQIAAIRAMADRIASGKR